MLWVEQMSHLMPSPVLWMAVDVHTSQDDDVLLEYCFSESDELTYEQNSHDS